MGPKANTMLNGEHTRVVQVATSNVGALMKFAVKTVQCLGCRTPLKDQNMPVCKNCRPRVAQLYHEKLARASALEVEFARLWTCCQRCQGSLAQMCCVYEQGLSDLFQAEEGAEGCRDAVHVVQRFDTAW